MAEFQQQNRRDFMKYMFGTAAVLSGLQVFPNEVLTKKGIGKLTILYTAITNTEKCRNSISLWYQVK